MKGNAKFMDETVLYIIMGIFGVVFVVLLSCVLYKQKKEYEEKLRKEAELNLLKKNIENKYRFISFDKFGSDDIDDTIIVKSRATLDNFTYLKYLKDSIGHYNLNSVERTIEDKKALNKNLRNFLDNNEFQNEPQYDVINNIIKSYLSIPIDFRIEVKAISTANNVLGVKTVIIDSNIISQLKDNPSLLMTKTEYNQLIKTQEKDSLAAKRTEYYDRVNSIIDNVNNNKNELVNKKKADELDALISNLFDKTVNNIQKIKTSSSEEWTLIKTVIDNIENDVNSILNENKEILDYYKSDDFKALKDTCNNLMSTQKEFNEYIEEKASSISGLFGKSAVRNETVNNDEYNYIRPYKKTITPFTTEVSKTVFASAENNPLDYVIKQFYPTKELYPEQIQKLHSLVEELETLKEAKVIIDDYKKEYQQYLVNVPSFILEKDESGFYSRLGFANINENVLTIEYKFSYTSDGGFAQRSFTVPMTEETIIELISRLESKLTFSAFAKEQRALMTSKLRQQIKERDNYTCCLCGNSTHTEPNLLLEIDHIIPVAKGGVTKENNLQTLCWKCNRSKSDKMT